MMLTPWNTTRKLHLTISTSSIVSIRVNLIRMGIKKVKKFGPKYTNQQLSDLDKEIPGAVYLPVDDQSRHVKVPPAKIVIAVAIQILNMYLTVIYNKY